MRERAGWVGETITTMSKALMTAHGSAGFAESASLQRVWRDQATASRHGHTLAASGFEAYGKTLFGREEDARFVLPIVCSDRQSTRLNSSHSCASRLPSSH